MPARPEWQITAGLTGYDAALELMERRVGTVASGLESELVWLVEHPPLYSAGTSAKPEDLLNPRRFPVYQTGRGGQFTYHGPGQRVVYTMLSVQTRFGGDVRAFVAALEAWMMRTLLHFGVKSFTIAGRTGLWVDDGGLEPAKIAAIGLRIRHGISFHGVALNVAPELSHFDGIVPCGLKDSRVTSLAALGIDASMSAVDAALAAEFHGFSER